MIASLNARTEGGWVTFAKQIQQAGADALELNVYFMATNPEMDGHDIEAVHIDILKQVKSITEVPIILSGGLNTQNVIEPVNVLKPYAVDVNSGVEEAPGKKDPKKMKDFIDIVSYISGAKVKEHI